MKRRSEEGFSLIELLIVLAIIGMLAAIIVPVLGKIGFKNSNSSIGSERSLSSSGDCNCDCSRCCR